MFFRTCRRKSMPPTSGIPAREGMTLKPGTGWQLRASKTFEGRFYFHHEETHSSLWEFSPEWAERFLLSPQNEEPLPPPPSSSMSHSQHSSWSSSSPLSSLMAMNGASRPRPLPLKTNAPFSQSSAGSRIRRSVSSHTGIGDVAPTLPSVAPYDVAPEGAAASPSPRSPRSPRLLDPLPHSPAFVDENIQRSQSTNNFADTQRFPGRRVNPGSGRYLAQSIKDSEAVASLPHALNTDASSISRRRSESFENRSRSHSSQASSPLSPSYLQLDRLPSPVQGPFSWAPNDNGDGDAEELTSRFTVVAGLGTGGYSIVLKVEEAESRQPFAMKVVTKARVHRRRDRRRMRNELQVLTQLPPSPFVQRCHAAFESPSRIFFVTDLCSGGDLFFHLVQRIKATDAGFEESEAKTLLAEIVLGLEHMHQHGFIHRDIKIENCMLDSRGHVKLIDFGLSRMLQSTHNNRALPPARARSGSNNEEHLPSAVIPPAAAAAAISPTASSPFGTFTSSIESFQQEPVSPTGSLIYMAPEVLRHRLGGRHTDWWALGVLAHELLTGRTPWSSLTDKRTIQREIASMRVTPPAGVTPAAGQFVSSLLAQDPQRRLGSASSRDVRCAAFFRGVDWDVAERGCLPPALRNSSSTCTSPFEEADSTSVLAKYIKETENEAMGNFSSSGSDFSLGLPKTLVSPNISGFDDAADNQSWDSFDGESEQTRREASELRWSIGPQKGKPTTGEATTPPAHEQRTSLPFHS